MWQRKQTIFLGLTAFCLVFMIFFPIWIGVDGRFIWKLYPLHYTIQEGEASTVMYYPYAITAMLAVAAATIAVISIGKFENRLLQLKLGALNSLFMAGTLMAAVYFAMQMIKLNQIGGEYGWALYLPAIAMICNLIANRYIRKDEKLVKDSERLR